MCPLVLTTTFYVPYLNISMTEFVMPQEILFHQKKAKIW